MSCVEGCIESLVEPTTTTTTTITTTTITTTMTTTQPELTAGRGCIKARDNGYNLLQASLRYMGLQYGCLVQSPAVVMSATHVDEPQPEAEPDEAVVEHRHRVEVTRALQAATAQGDVGDFDQAQKLIASSPWKTESYEGCTCQRAC